MSVRERLEDAVLLWNNGRKQGAWIQVLIAAAAISKLRFPDQKDGEAFRQFIREVTPTIVNGTAPAIPGGITVVFNAETPEQMPLDQVMYKHMRCYLLHEAVMPSDVCLSESHVVDGKLVADLRGGSPLTIPDFWVIHLAKAVAYAPENSAACAGLFT
ncbi:MAG: hypothetical protein HY708_04310 [Ignavibacteriae bacterium]|nr:hypothetical protein [Ignavibacteriota bacterium]